MNAEDEQAVALLKEYVSTVLIMDDGGSLTPKDVLELIMAQWLAICAPILDQPYPHKQLKRNT